MRRRAGICAAATAIAALVACSDSGGSTTDSSGGATQRVWKLIEISADGACGTTAQSFAHRLTPPRTGTLPSRLSDHIPDSVPVAGWRPVAAIPLSPGTPGEDVAGAHGWTRGFTTTFNSATKQGGFVAYILEYETSAAAVDDAAAYHEQLVCARGLDAFDVEGHTGIIVSKGFEQFVATWVHGARRIDVRSQIFSDPEAETRNALIGTEATWNAG